MKLHHITFAGKPKGGGEDGQSPQDQNIASQFPLLFIVGPPVKKVALHGAEILRPLGFNMDQGPLAAAKGKMLETGE